MTDEKGKAIWYTPSEREPLYDEFMLVVVNGKQGG